MSLTTRDRVGFYLVPLVMLGVAVQHAIHGQDGATGWRDIVFFYALAVSLGPFLLVFPASWRREISEKRRSQVPKMAGMSPAMAGLLAAFLFEFRGFEPRTGILLAAVGIFNLALFRLLAGKHQMEPPSRWTSLSFFTGAGIGAGAALIEIDLTLVLLSGASYGLYFFANHWVIRSIIDQPAPDSMDSPRGSEA